MARPTLFRPTVVRSTVEDSGIMEAANASTYYSSSLGSTSSFRYSQNNSGLQSTQQLNVDWSEFANHTFFHSAQVKTNTALQKLIDYYPFDGTQTEFELFCDQLTGWEKYLLDSLPKNVGYLFFSGSAEPVNGTYVEVLDLEGSNYPTISRQQTGNAILNPETKSMTVEQWLWLPPQSNDNQIILQKYESGHGFTFGVSSSLSTTTCNLYFEVASGSTTNTVSGGVTKDAWNHIATVWDRSEAQQKLFMFVNHALVASSSQVEFGSLNCDSATLYIGSGSATTSFTPQETLSGAIDELRVWHTIRSQQQREEYAKKNIFAQDHLRLYYKFNEPSGSASDVVLDSSGNSLHGTLSSDAYATIGIRDYTTGSLIGSSPVTSEKLSNNPILFPNHEEIVALQAMLLASASVYDSTNPNLITRLVPKHYLLEGMRQDNLETESGGIIDINDSGNNPKEFELGSTQIMLSILYLWATFFDELKLFIQHFSSIQNVVDYGIDGTIPDKFLTVLAEKYGIELPSFFEKASIEQFINAENIDTDYSTNSYSLQYVQNQIWRRILINVRDMVNSKGTMHAVKSFIRAAGINPDSNFRIKEHGGPTKRELSNARVARTEVASMVTFASGGYARTPVLSGSRVEPGFPTIAGTANDKLLTSGSWTVEGIYCATTSSAIAEQSLIRMTVQNSTTRYNLANLLVTSGSGVTFVTRPNMSGSILSMSLSNFDPFDGQVWSFCFGRTRNDAVNSVSSSYFLKFARNSFGEVVEEYTTQSWFNDNTPTTAENYWQVASGTIGVVSGVFMEIGSGSTVAIANSGIFLNNVNEKFDGFLSQIRFWSKDLSTTEWREHVRNFKSIGTEVPTRNSNFEQQRTGSFEKIRVDVSTDQPTTTTDVSGSITLFDFSQNALHFSGSVFPATSSVIVPKTFYYSIISPNFDEAVTENKVRIRGYSNLDTLLNNEMHYAELSPVYEIPRSEQPNDSNKFSIDFSVVDSLNQDMVNLFATLDEMDNAIGEPSLLYTNEYPTLASLRDLYFNRLTDKINLKGLFEFYKWFDTSLGNFIHQLLPKKTKFNGCNYVVEQHMLERSKYTYHTEDIYLGTNTRSIYRSIPLLQLLVGTFTRY